MLHNAIGNSLPQKYAGVLTIRNFSVREGLTTALGDIQRLLEEVKDIEIDDKTANTLDQFFTYLKASCQSVADINIRGPWLMTYAEVVREKLRQFRTSNVHWSLTDYGHLLHDEMQTLVVEMTEHLARYKTVHMRPIGDYDHIDEVVERIVDVASKSEIQTDGYYRSVNDYLNRIVDRLKNDLTVIEAHGPLYNELMTLSRKMYSYRRRGRSVH